MPIQTYSSYWSWWNVLIVVVVYGLPIATVLWVMLCVVKRTKLSADNTSRLVAQQERIIELLEESTRLQAEANLGAKRSGGKGAR